VTDNSSSSANRQARDEKKGAYLRALFERHAQRFRAAASGDAPGLARSAHAALDEVLERDRTRSADSSAIRCRKGCDHCCHGPVEIWPQEAALLLEAARAAGVNVDKARLERQSRHSVDTWHGQPAADRACVFLGEGGACKIYDSRPNACRKLLVVADPELCDGAKHPPGSAERWFSWEAEMLEAAALETFGRLLMPQALLAASDKAKGESRKAKE
jgi:Fe-S-cluster containining protein